MTARAQKPRLAVHWAASCGGCEVALINLGARLVDLEAVFEIVYCPCLVDVKLDELRGYAEGQIDVCLFNGAVHTADDREMAHLLRRASRLLVAFGSCAHEGGVPGLANLGGAGALARGIGDGPLEGCPGPPPLFGQLLALEQVERVDFTIPGCPPEAPRLWAALEQLAARLRGDGPADGAVLGGGGAAVCEECPRERRARRVRRFLRPHEIVADPGCLLEQGLVCLGPATRGGCGALCPRAGAGCRGCYGAPVGVRDQGAQMVAAMAAVLDVCPPERGHGAALAELEAAAAGIADPAGTFYRHSLARSLLQRARCAPPGRGGGREEP